MLNFGQKIKKLHTDADLSQAMLAEHIGVSVQSISNWECNNTMPDISQIVPLASILCVSTDCLERDLTKKQIKKHSSAT